MRCPVCKSDLILGEGKRAYQTLVEHVCDPNSDVNEKEYFICSNKSCEIQPHVFWDDFGDAYSSGNDYFDLKERFGILYPYGSSRMKSWVEHEKTDENFTLLNLFFIKWRAVFQYKADTDGNILSRKLKIETSIRKGKMWILHISSWHMFKFSIEWFESIVERYLNNPNNKSISRELAREYENIREAKQLYKKAASWWIGHKYGHIVKMIKIEELFSK